MENGILKILTSNIIYTNYLIYVRPYNNYIWAWEDEDDRPKTFHVADITIKERPFQPPNPLPIFDESLEKVNMMLEDGQSVHVY